jgi:hypothetical protein
MAISDSYKRIAGYDRDTLQRQIAS